MFGASKGGELFIINANKNNEYEILAIADNDGTKQGTFFHGYPVICPSKILDYDYDFIMITSAFVLQIYKQLTDELNVEPSKIKAVEKSILDIEKTKRAFEDKNTLNLARNILLFVTKLLDDNNIPYFIDHGTLLGIVRDGDLIPWDDDIDISIYSDDMERTIMCIEKNISKFPKYEELLWSARIFYQENYVPDSIEITFDQNNKLEIRKFPISIKSIFFKNGFAIQKITYAPEFHFKKREFINYMGREISVPYHYKQYLEFHYGEWKVHKKDCSFLDIKNYKEPTCSINKNEDTY